MSLDPERERKRRWWAENRERCNREKRERHASDPDYRAKKIRVAQERRARNRAIADEFKMERGCSRCGYREHPVALDLHHVDGERKEFSVSGQIASLKRLREELAKCEVLCANCHRIHHFSERG